MRGPLGGPQNFRSMDEDYAFVLLHAVMKEFRRQSYSALVESIGHTHPREIRVPDGTPFKATFRVLWASEARGAVRVIGFIHDSRQGTKPVSVEFIKKSDNTFVDH